MSAPARAVAGRRADAPELRRLRLAIEASGEVMFTTDREGVFTYVNPEFERTYGYTADEIVGRATPRILKGGSTARGAYESFWAGLLEKKVVRRTFLNRTKDGALLHIESSANPIIGDDGELVGFLAVQRDVTERTQMEAALKESEQRFQQAQKMEAIGRLAGGIAHDFNNLLTAILGYTQLVLDEVHPPELRADIEEIQKAGERASRLTRQLLAFTRNRPATMQSVNLNDVVSDISAMLGRLLGDDIQVKRAAASDLWKVDADPGQIEQVLLNLAVNARDAMPKGGSLMIATENVDAADPAAAQRLGLMPGRYASLQVRDTGCGMSAEVVAHALEPFYTTKPVGQGTGLGLSTVYGILKQQGGHIAIESRPGVGTAVMTFWPKKETRREAIEPAAGLSRAPAPAGTEAILVVEDDVSLRSLVRKILQPLGYRVLEAQDVSDALAIAGAADRPIDLLLTDVIMPGMNGPDLAQRIVAQRRGIRVLYMSGYANSLLSELDITRPRMAFLAKPFKPQALALKVRETLDS